MLLEALRESWAAGEQQDEHDHRHDGDIERQLLDVPEPEPQGRAEVVAALTDDAVGAEEVGERLPAYELDTRDEQAETRDHAVERREGRRRRRSRPISARQSGATRSAATKPSACERVAYAAASASARTPIRAHEGRSSTRTSVHAKTSASG